MNRPMIVSSFQTHFYPTLPKFVVSDINKKVYARSKRENASRSSLESFAMETTKKSFLSADHIERRYPFASRRIDRNEYRKITRYTERKKRRIGKIQTSIKSDMHALTHDILMLDEKRKTFGLTLVTHLQKLILEFDGDGDEHHLRLLCRKLSKLIRHYHITPPRLPKRPTFEQYFTAITKMTTDDWINDRLERLKFEYIEYSQISLGRVGNNANQSKYVSAMTLNNFLEAQDKQAKFLADYCIYNADEDISVDLENVFMASTSNPENRRIEMMVRSRGFEELADAKGYTAAFITWTLASQYHRNSKNWNGANPKEGHQNLMKQWSRARAILAKQGVDYFGFRVAEPHKDGTAHAHYFLFCKEEEKELIVSTLRDIAIEEDKQELYYKTVNGKSVKRNKPVLRARFDCKFCDPSKGGATAYIAKYIAKNLNGSHMSESDKKAAQSVRAWASLWRIRQFQQFGGAPVSIWRALRKTSAEEIKALKCDELSELHGHADKSRWKDFVQGIGDAQITYEEKENRYFETVKKIVGFSFMHHCVNTIKAQWEIIRKSDLKATQKRDGVPSRSTENNCNPAPKKPISPLEKALMDLTGWNIKRVQCLVKPLTLGIKVTIDDMTTVSIRNGRLAVS
ncbi:replication endonuclease [Vibrio sp. DW001]|uniref:replication endonuclease n=1 Tax=Vibrio sp. DW001 TaxID=2912315 RepID=UPI0023AFA3CB|nr:replication endonuclease [Vibrio sp. DW001]WED26430.1 replication endonuclease [Vibrio sp. DW001]